MAAILLSFFGALGSALRTRGGLVLENLTSNAATRGCA